MSIADGAPRVAVCSTDTSLREKARELADRLALDFINESLSRVSIPDLNLDLLLVVTANSRHGYHLELRDAQNPKTGLVVDFIHGKNAYRIQRGGGRKQALARAVGLKSKPKSALKVLDATAGLGRDAFVLAGLECEVTLIERSPIVAALLADGLRRAADDDNATGAAVKRMQLHVGSATELLPSICMSLQPNVIYLDPMYPDRTKSAAVKKDMRLLQILLGSDKDSSELLALALQNALNRVVVKRPKSAATLDGATPTHTIVTKSTRYDVYMT
jgi:16S rRNA (guanine1516-N2)-methyltransferase